MMLHTVDEKSKEESKISFCTSEIAPEEVRRFNVELRGLNAPMIVLHHLICDAEIRRRFVVHEVLWRRVDDSSTGIILPREEGPYNTSEDLSLRPMLVPRDAILEIAVKNVWTAPLRFSGRISIYGLEGTKDEAAPREGILGRCRTWFLDGLREAVSDKLAAKCDCEDSSEVVMVPAAPRVIDSIRRAAASLADLAEIPAVAASLYWRSVANLGREEEKVADVGRPVVYWFSLALLPGQESHAPIDVAGRFVADRIYLDPCDVGALLTGYRNFCTQDLVSFGEPVVASGLARMSSGLAIDGDIQAKAGETIEIHVRNVGDARQIYRGFLLGREA